MNLPSGGQAFVSEEKIKGYLLSPSHPTGGGKAAFFCRFGFDASDWRVLAEALLRHAEANEVAKVEDTPFGTRYTVEGRLKSPDGRDPMVRVVWFIEHGEETPRLVTAYPC